MSTDLMVSAIAILHHDYVTPQKGAKTTPHFEVQKGGSFCNAKFTQPEKAHRNRLEFCGAAATMQHTHA